MVNWLFLGKFDKIIPIEIMKKIVVVASLLALVGCAGSGDSSIPQLKYDGLNGDVERVRESFYEIEEKFGEAIPTELEEVVIYDFSADGHLIKQATYDEDGDFLHGFEMEWNGDKCVQSSSNSRWQEEPVVTKFLSESNGVTLCEESANGKTTQYEEEKIENGLTRTMIRRENGKETMRIVCTFDKRGKMLHQHQQWDGKELEIRNKIDKEGLLVERMMKAPEYLETVRYQYKEFDAKGNWTKALVVRSQDGDVEGMMALREYTYRR